VESFCLIRATPFLARPGFAPIPELGQLKRAVGAGGAKCFAEILGKRMPSRSLFDRHVGHAAKFRRLYG
jgi:hypothetical protein